MEILCEDSKLYSQLEIIRNSHHGFVRDKSCLRNLIEFFEDMSKVIDEGGCFLC